VISPVVAPVPAPAAPIVCRPLAPFDHADLADLAAVRAAFRSATPISLGQAWRDTPERDFAPATVRTGWRGDTLFVFAELSDADIFTRANQPNERFWELGDTFEMFLQAPPGPAYVEFHVAPNNLRLQLRLASAPTPTPARLPPSAADPFEVSLLPDKMFSSRTWIDEGSGLWCVLADIPTAAVTNGRTASQSDGGIGGSPGAVSGLAGAHWRFSFSRYDYTRGRAQPVISSSSPHTEPRFHRPHEWGVLRFVGSDRGQTPHSRGLTPV